MPLDEPMSDKIQSLVAQLTRYNEAYRVGLPLISDHEYDGLTEQLRLLDAEHPFLHTVEEEQNFADFDQVRHATPMLSTEKAYTLDALAKFVERVEKAAAAIGIADIQYKVTPKLDGLAGNDLDGVFATRGNGRVGSNITMAFARGVVPIGGRGGGRGEIVISMTYFEAHCAGDFEHPRNMVVGVINADEIKPLSRAALDTGAVHFVPYTTLATWRGDGEALLRELPAITADLKARTDYALDGMVAEALDDRLKAHMGATNHHNRWQIAIKERGETAQTRIAAVVWQTGRTGVVTPVLEIEPIQISGATINRVTAHNAGMIRDLGLGPDAQVVIIRSGEVIPKLEQVVSAVDPLIVNACPSCQGPLRWRKDFLVCDNADACPAQMIEGLRFFFKTLNTADGFGPKSLLKLVEGGFLTLETVYAVTDAELQALGFGPGQSKNLLAGLANSKREPIEDARFLTAFGIQDLGIGASRRILARHRLEALNAMTADALADIHGFAALTAGRIVDGLAARWGTISHMLALGFRLDRTPLLAEQRAIQSPIAGKKIVFTGKMLQGARKDMQAGARELGAVVQSSVSGSTELLVAGEKASPAKVKKARDGGAQVLTEAEYLALIATGEA